MRRIIGIVSGKGGVGKTTITINLAAALMQFSKNVIAVDADLRMSGLGLQLGMYNFPVTLNDVLRGKTDLLEALYIHSSGLRIIPASLCIEDINIDAPSLENIFKDPFLENSIVLVDSPPGLGEQIIEILRTCKEIILVITPEFPAIADAMKLISAIEKTESRPIGIIVNKYRKGDAEQITIKEIEFACNLPVIGVISEDEHIRKSIFRRVPNVFLNPNSQSSIAFKKIAAELTGLKYNPPKVGFFKKFWRRGK